MLTKFICLANSFKEGGRCLAGIGLDNNNIPIIINGRPKWLRPVCNTEHGEIPNSIAENLNVLNVIEFSIKEFCPQGYQSENVTFDEHSICGISNFNRNNLEKLCDNRNLIFGNRGKAVSQDTIGNLNHSLLLISVTQFEVTKKVYEDRPDRHQIRLTFVYNGNSYDFPITDPAFLLRYQSNYNLLTNVNQLYLSLSLGVVWNDWYYKLVAGIIL